MRRSSVQNQSSPYEALKLFRTALLENCGYVCMGMNMPTDFGRNLTQGKRDLVKDGVGKGDFVATASLILNESCSNFVTRIHMLFSLQMEWTDSGESLWGYYAKIPPIALLSTLVKRQFLHGSA
ncbi:hypothetical protein Y032_0575g191 [Ancylostoma ceylanicum]|uniref:Uncharacterized protein n=1 Tax=Ancylostoma ceylanicum TaxID=53326 RepID=A0A016WN52_9BILA|nr:hypothetical protein Y032_0575g191 [Ancylostoma ceylanicum]